MLPHIGPTIAVSVPERDFLHEAVRRALKETPDVTVRRALGNKALFWSIRVRLQVKGRRSDGGVSAEVQITVPSTKKRYVRKLELPATLGSTSPRDSHLRRAGSPT